MHLIFVHGAPATGKYAIGRALALRTGFELYHNHLVVDEVLRQHPFGTPEFVVEREQRWRSHLATASQDPARRMIFTFNPENTVRQAFIDWLFADLPGQGVVLYSIGLVLAEPVIEARLASDQRRQFRKLADPALYRQLREAGAFATPVIPRTDLVIDTEFMPPEGSANQIVRRFNLV